MLQRLSEYAEKQKIHLAIEALQKDESCLANTVADLQQLLKDVDRPMLKVCLDTGAMTAAGEEIQDYFDAFGSDVIHSHFVDVKEGVTHLAWGDGARDMAQDLVSFAKNGYQGLLSVEAVNPRYFKEPQKADAQSMAMYRRLRK